MSVKLKTDLRTAIMAVLLVASGSPLPSLSIAADELTVAAVLTDKSALAGAHDIEVRDGLAYLAGKGGSLAIVDVRQPAAPKLLWSVRDPAVYEDAETVLPLDGNRLLIGTRDVLLFDVRLPTQPQLLAKLQDRPRIETINGFARHGDVVFAANKRGYICAVDVAEPQSLRLLGARHVSELDSLTSPHDVALCGDVLIVVSPEGFGRTSRPGKLALFRVIDLATRRVLPADQWTRLGQIEHRRLAGANRIRTRGNFAYVCGSLAQNMGRDDDLKSSVSIVDLRSPSEPRLASSVDFPDARGPNGLEIAGVVAFAAGGQTVLALDVSDPNSPRELARLTAPSAFPSAADDAHDLVYHNGHLLITAQTSHSLVVVEVRGDRIHNAAEK